MTKAITLKKALRIAEGVDQKTSVDVFIEYVNSLFANKDTIKRHRCSAEMGHFYQMGLNLCEVTPEECLQIELAFRTAGWKDVQVVYWVGALRISLEMKHSRGWASHYNGEAIDPAVYGLSGVLPRRIAADVSVAAA